MRESLLILLLVLCAFPSAVMAQQKPLQIDLAQERVDITTGFNGTRVVIFGTLNIEGADIVITLRGPETKLIVRKKDPVMGAWMNRENVEFRRVPSYYDYNATLADYALLAKKEIAQTNQIGVNNLDFYPDDADENPQIVGLFRDALIRRMQQKGFYSLKAGSVQRLNPGFFKTSFDLPPGVPTGIYTVDAYLIGNDTVAAHEAKTFQVGQVGFNARVYSFAQNSAFLYGIFCVVFAFVTGWSAFTFLRRD